MSNPNKNDNTHTEIRKRIDESPGKSATDSDVKLSSASDHIYPTDATKFDPNSCYVVSPYDHIVDADKWEAAVGHVTKDSLCKLLPSHLLTPVLWKSFWCLFYSTFYLLVGLQLFYVAHERMENWLMSISEVGSYCSISMFIRVFFWTSYSITIGTLATGHWVIAHECGHGAFSETKWIGDLVGFILHTILLVPYFSWQFSHGKHHKFTNHMKKGETFVPDVMNNISKGRNGGKLRGKLNVIILYLTLVFGWPGYLLKNVSGGSLDWQGRSLEEFKGTALSLSHFTLSTDSKLFPPNWMERVRISTLATIGWIVFLALLPGFKISSILAISGKSVLLCYVCPLVVVNIWLVLYTKLHHTDHRVPHYGDKSFCYMRGALCTIDRKYSKLINHIHHNIGSTHVCHHINSKIPHYHAVEATEVLKKVLIPKGLYRYDGRSVFTVLSEVALRCEGVSGREGVQYYGVTDQSNNNLDTLSKSQTNSS